MAENDQIHWPTKNNPDWKVYLNSESKIVKFIAEVNWNSES